MDQLSDYQQERASLVEDKVEEKDKEQLEQAQKTLKHVEEVNKQFEQCNQELKLTELKLQTAENALGDRTALIENLRQESQNHDALLSQIKELEIEAKKLKKNLDIAQKDLAAAKISHEQSQLTTKKAREYHKSIGVQNNIKHIEGQLKKIHT
ncbi:hypothetical protein, partial [Legionella pneumophila]|uniref:hypothetical protein n=1 Tax=Legionella pneumophila TaxID=446 RepID=UPI0010AAC1C8